MAIKVHSNNYMIKNKFAINLRAITSLIRIDHWIKNILVLIVPLTTTSVLTSVNIESDMIHILTALAAFCCISSSIYIINDYLDVDRDRMHPIKKNRPLASGELTLRTAAVTIVILLCMAMVFAFQSNIRVLGIIIIYFFINIAYSAKLKHIPLIEIGIVCAGFALRVMAGATAVESAINYNLMGATVAGSFALIIAKRRSELMREYEHNGLQRPVLSQYTKDTLDQIFLVSCVCAGLLYLEWIESIVSESAEGAIAGIILLMLIGMLRMLQLMHDDTGILENLVRLLKDDSQIRVIALLIIVFTVAFSQLNLW